MALPPLRIRTPSHPAKGPVSGPLPGRRTTSWFPVGPTENKRHTAGIWFCLQGPETTSSRWKVSEIRLCCLCHSGRGGGSSHSTHLPGKKELVSFTHLPQEKCPKNFVFIIKPCSTNLKSKQKTGNKQHEVFPPKGGVQSSANKLNVKL